jgi:hypothetical protein
MAKDRAYSRTHGGLGCGGTSPAGKSSGAGAKPETTLSMVSHSQERQYLSCGAGVALVWRWCGTGVALVWHWGQTRFALVRNREEQSW